MNTQQTRIMVFGTFDVLHKGHLNLFAQARRLAKRPYLIVSIARDENVKKIKGKNPLHGQGLRLLQVRSLAAVNRAVLGGLKNHIPHIIKHRPDIIALGYDQKHYVKNLAQDLAKKGLKVKIKRLKAYYPRKFKSSLIKA